MNKIEYVKQRPSNFIGNLQCLFLTSCFLSSRYGDETPKMLSEKASRVIAVINNWNPCLGSQEEMRFLHTPYQTLNKRVARAPVRDGIFLFLNSLFNRTTIKFTFN